MFGIYVIATAGMHLANKQGVTEVRANKPPPNRLPEAVQLPAIILRQTSDRAALQTHTHTRLNLLMSGCCWDTQH